MALLNQGDFKFCVICQSSFVSQSNYEKHILTKTHLTNYEKMCEQRNKELEFWQERTLPNELYFFRNCLFCNTSFLYKERDCHYKECECYNFIKKYRPLYRNMIEDIHRFNKVLDYFDRNIKLADYLIREFETFKMMNISQNLFKDDFKQDEPKPETYKEKRRK